MYALIPQVASTLFIRLLLFHYIWLTSYWTHYFGSETFSTECQTQPPTNLTGNKMELSQISWKNWRFWNTVKRWRNSVESALGNQHMRDYGFHSTWIFCFWFNAYQRSNKIQSEEMFLEKKIARKVNTERISTGLCTAVTDLKSARFVGLFWLRENVFYANTCIRLSEWYRKIGTCDTSAAFNTLNTQQLSLHRWSENVKLQHTVCVKYISPLGSKLLIKNLRHGGKWNCRPIC